MEQILVQNAQKFATSRQRQLDERLGFGIHGIIFSTKNNLESGATAIKAHREKEPFLRELAVYRRLMDAQISEILGFNVPRLLDFDAELLVLEMTIVTRPFVLDFAGAYLDSPPVFTDEIWADWEAEKQEQFGERWPVVQNVLGALENLDIHMIDVSPSNIAFAN